MALGFSFLGVGCSENGDANDTSDSSADDSADDGGDETGANDGTDETYAQIACSLLAGPLTPLVAASSVDEASQALIVPSESEAWSIEASGADSYVMLEVEDWMVTVRVFATAGVEVEILGVAQTVEQAPNEDCKAYTDQAFEIHEWGSYVLHLQGEGEIEFAAIQEAVEE